MSSKAHPRPYELLSARSHKFKAALIPSRARAIYRRGSFGFLVLALSARTLHSSACSIRNLRSNHQGIANSCSAVVFGVLGKGVTMDAGLRTVLGNSSRTPTEKFTFSATHNVLWVLTEKVLDLPPKSGV